MAPSQHDWKIVDWDVKPQHNQPTNMTEKLLTGTLNLNTTNQLACETAVKYGKSIRGVSGLALEESKMHTFSRIKWIIFSEKYLCKV